MGKNKNREEIIIKLDDLMLLDLIKGKELHLISKDRDYIFVTSADNIMISREKLDNLLREASSDGIHDFLKTLDGIQAIRRPVAEELNK